MPHDETIDILSYLRRLSKHALPALVPAVVVGLLLGLLAHFTGGVVTGSVQEKAHVLVLPQKVTSEADATQQSQLIPMMMRTYVALEDAPEYVDAVSAATKGKFTPEQVAEGLTIYWGGGSALLAFQATAPTKEDADLLANTGAEVFTTKADAMVPAKERWNPTLTVVERSVPMNPDAVTPAGSSPLVPAVGGALVTFVLATLLLEALAARRERHRATGSTRARTN